MTFFNNVKQSSLILVAHKVKSSRKGYDISFYLLNVNYYPCLIHVALCMTIVPVSKFKFCDDRHVFLCGVLNHVEKIANYKQGNWRGGDYPTTLDIF